MHKGYVLKTLAIFGSALLLVYGGFITTNFLHKTSHHNLTSLDISYTKSKTSLHQENLIQVEISIKDDLTSQGETIEEVTFNQEKLTLKNADSFGKRGTHIFQLKTGSYLLCWKVKNNYPLPKVTKYSKEIVLDASQPWVHILIKGPQVTITN